ERSLAARFVFRGETCKPDVQLLGHGAERVEHLTLVLGPVGFEPLPAIVAAQAAQEGERGGPEPRGARGGHQASCEGCVPRRVIRDPAFARRALPPRRTSGQTLPRRAADSGLLRPGCPPPPVRAPGSCATPRDPGRGAG